MTHGRVRLLPSTAVLTAFSAAALFVAACEPDHPRDVPGAPHIISAYVIDQVALDNCDTSDPRAFGGGFTTRSDPTSPPTPVRCIADLTLVGTGNAIPDLDDPPMGFASNAQLQVVFNE